MALAHVLADLYPTESDQRRIAGQLGIESLTDIDGSPVVVWTNIVREARRHRRIGMLIVTALTEYPTNGTLQAAIDDELSRRIPVSHDYDDGDRNAARADQALLVRMIGNLQTQIAAVQKENVERRHAQDNTLQSLVSQVAVLVSKDAARERREELIQESISALSTRMGAVEGALRSLNPEGRAESYVSPSVIRQAIWLALGFVLALGLFVAGVQLVQRLS